MGARSRQKSLGHTQFSLQQCLALFCKSAVAGDVTTFKRFRNVQEFVPSETRPVEWNVHSQNDNCFSERFAVSCMILPLCSHCPIAYTQRMVAIKVLTASYRRPILCRCRNTENVTLAKINQRSRVDFHQRSHLCTPICKMPGPASGG